MVTSEKSPLAEVSGASDNDYPAEAQTLTINGESYVAIKVPEDAKVYDHNGQLVAPILTDNKGNAWYGAADPNDTQGNFPNFLDGGAIEYADGFVKLIPTESVEV